MKTKIFYLVILFSITYFSVNSQNLLDISTWTVSSGFVLGFGKNGATSENSRELGRNHIGEKVVLWKAAPDHLAIQMVVEIPLIIMLIIKKRIV